MKVSAIVPTCRSFTVPKQSIDVSWIVVHDREEREVVGEAEHIIAPDPTMWGARCSSIRSAGFLKAYEEGADIILTTDDDLHFPTDWAEDHVRGLTSELHPWSMTMDFRMRGLPYLARALPVAITHGLWDGIPDVDARTWKETGGYRVRHKGEWKRIHPPFCLSSMNFGFIREVMPVMYQPAQGEGYAYSRFDDIWLGLLAERLLMFHGYGFLNGGACVYHERASDPEENFKQEAPGIKTHERFWKWIWDWTPAMAGGSLVGDYLALADRVEAFKDETPYFVGLAANMRRWVKAVGDAS
jgi:hypothetical protein